MAGFNKVILMGRVATDVEIKQTTTGKQACSFRLAVGRPKYGNAEETDFINIVAWEKTAEFANKYFSKGDAMLLDGSLRIRSYEKANGEKAYVTEVLAERISFCESKKREAEPQPQGNMETPAPYNGNIEFEETPDEDDLPF